MKRSVELLSVPHLVKAIAWYDNESGYACRVADLCAFMGDKGL